MKILVIGATGPLGREILNVAKSHGHAVAALARQPHALSELPEVKTFKGDVFDLKSLKAAMTGIDVVISAYGLSLTRKPTTLLSEGTSNMVQAMRESQVSRFICVTGIGAGDSKGHGGFLFDRILQPLLLNEMYIDKTRQEEVIRESKLDWTIVRPAVLSNGDLTSSYRAATDLTGFSAKKISRKDAADFIINEITKYEFSKNAVSISY